MPAIITNKFRVHNAEQFVEAFSEAEDTKMYLFIGRISEWDDDTNPPTPTDSFTATEFSHWRDMIAAKRIVASDVSHVVPRYNWETGTVYDQFDDTDTNILTDDFYVMNSNFFVYKCLFNNGGAQSTVEPTGTSTSVIETADGYKWKFMYEINGAKALKFITPTNIPVQTLGSDDGTTQWDVQQAAIDGAIDVVLVTSGGSSYSQSANATVFSVTNSSVFAINTASSGANTTNDYYNGAGVYVDGGTGIGQLAEVSDYAVSGNTATITLASGLSTPLVADDSTVYIHPRVTISTGTDGAGAEAYAVVNSSASIESVEVSNVGADYTRASVSIDVSAAAQGVGATGSGATARAIIGPKGGHGSNAIEELGGFRVMLNSRLENSESNNFTIVNDFRKIGLIRDPNFANGDIATSTVIDQSLKLTLANTDSTFTLDEEVTGGTSGATGRVVDMNDTTGVLRLINTNGTFQNTETVTGANSSTSDTINGIEEGGFQVDSGDVIYIENRQPIARANDQIEDIKVTITF